VQAKTVGKRVLKPLLNVKCSDLGQLDLMDECQIFPVGKVARRHSICWLVGRGELEGCNFTKLMAERNKLCVG